MCHGPCVEDRGQFSGFGPLFPLRRLLRSNSNHQAWRPLPLPAEISVWMSVLLLIFLTTDIPLGGDKQGDVEGKNSSETTGPSLRTLR